MARGVQRQSGGAKDLSGGTHFKATWETWSVGSLGATLLAGAAAGGQPGGRAQWAASAPVLLPVPDCVREAEAKEKARVAARLAKMASSKARRKVDMATIPKEELAKGSGPTIDAELFYTGKVTDLREGVTRADGTVIRPPRPELADATENLLDRVIQWRGDAAVRLGMAPVAVFADFIAKTLCYTLPTEPQDLRDAGIRVAGIESLAALIKAWKAEWYPVAAGEAAGSACVLPAGVVSAGKWAHAVMKVFPNNTTS